MPVWSIILLIALNVQILFKLPDQPHFESQERYVDRYNYLDLSNLIFPQIY